MTEIALGSEEMLTNLRLAARKLPRPVMLRVENAFDGFRRARELIDTDREIASFRAITAEEEAAAALFRSLQIREYENANRLSLKRHDHKAALGPFLQAIKSSYAGMKIRLEFDWAAPSIAVHLPLSQFGVEWPGQNLQITLVEPLGMVRKRGEDDPFTLFDDAVRAVAGSRKIDKLIASEANARNKILYASDSELPRSQATLASIQNREKRAMLAVSLCIAILQVEGRQALADQCLQAFLRVLDRQVE